MSALQRVKTLARRFACGWSSRYDELVCPNNLLEEMQASVNALSSLWAWPSGARPEPARKEDAAPAETGCRLEEQVEVD